MKIDAIATDYLGRVRLRLLEESERERFDLLLKTRHYLKSSRIGGRHLRYVAEVDGEWVALLAFSGAAAPPDIHTPTGKSLSDRWFPPILQPEHPSGYHFPTCYG